MAKKSALVENMDICYVCGRPREHIHHVFFGAKRDFADNFGYVIPLCNMHHTNSYACPHKNRDIDLYYKTMAQRHFERTEGTRSDFIKIFGKSYL